MKNRVILSHRRREDKRINIITRRLKKPWKESLLRLRQQRRMRIRNPTPPSMAVVLIRSIHLMKIRKSSCIEDGKSCLLSLVMKHLRRLGSLGHYQTFSST
uniref:Uncharacterized protein n=1 Tax=Brassica oleracea TaxID=3712 RepID=A0A3P6ATX8_BRAOL|nr:unnamed protein product [Brassica oleracea]